MTATALILDTVTVERDGHVLAIGLNRPEKRNSFNLAMLADLSRAYGLLESDETLRAAFCSPTATISRPVSNSPTSARTSSAANCRSPTTGAIRGGWTAPGPNPSSPRRTAGA